MPLLKNFPNLQKQDELSHLLFYTVCLALSCLDTQLSKYQLTLKNLLVFHFFHFLLILTLFFRLTWNSEHQPLQSEIVHKLVFIFLMNIFVTTLGTCNSGNSFSKGFKQPVTMKNKKKRKSPTSHHSSPFKINNLKLQKMYVKAQTYSIQRVD